MSTGTITADVCDHFYVTHLSPSKIPVSVRTCQTCGMPDWDDLTSQIKVSKPSPNLITKVAGGVFALVMAGIIVGVLAILVGLVVAGLRAVW